MFGVPILGTLTVFGGVVEAPIGQSTREILTLLSVPLIYWACMLLAFTVAVNLGWISH